jgi:hypothetical protein
MSVGIELVLVGGMISWPADVSVSGLGERPTGLKVIVLVLR